MNINTPKSSNSILKTLNLAKVGVWHIYTKERKLYINDVLAEIIGFKEEDLNAIEPGWFELHHIDEYPFTVQCVSELSESKTSSIIYETQVKHTDGHWINVHIQGKVCAFDEQGRPSEVAGTLIDHSDLNMSTESLDYRYKIEKLVSGISNDFVAARFDVLDNTIEETLGKIGRFCRVDRSYLFLMEQNQTLMTNTHEWCAPGVSAEKENLQNLPSSIFSWWLNKLRNKQPIYIRTLDEMPDEAAAEKAVLEAQNIISLLTVPIFARNEFLGFMGFDSISQKKEWSEYDIQLLETVANTFGNALVARQDRDLLLSQKMMAEESNRLKSAFLATMNHELRTPLHHILGFGDLLLNRKLTMTQTHLFASKIVDSGKNLLQIIEDVISLAVGEKSTIKIREDLINGLDLFVQHKAFMDEILAGSKRSKDIRLKMCPDVNLQGVNFIGDKNKINQILINLFRNALKFTESGTIEYGIVLDNLRLYFYVKDEGIGISDEKRELIFDYFRQGEDGSTRRFQGIGIGLSLCRNLVHILNGEISIQSVQGEGSTFTVSIPVKAASDSHDTPKKEQHLSIPDYSSHHFLLVDNDPNSLFLLKSLLVATKANILTTENCTETTDYIRENCFLDIIIVSIKADIDESLQLIREIKELNKQCTIIGITSHSLLADKEMAIEAGCSAVLSMPVDIQLLFESINGILRKNKCTDA